MNKWICGAMQGGAIVRTNIFETHATGREGYFRHQVEIKKIEIFLDFDPVSPDWPPIDPIEKALPRQAIGSIQEQDHP